MKLLFHQCCAPCSVFPVNGLIERKIYPHLYFYNPNIHPYTEYKKRLDTVVEYNNLTGLNYTVEDLYGLNLFLEMKQSAFNRCEGCYRMRMEKVAEFACLNGFNYFSTSLLYSVRQSHELIRKVCEEVAVKYGVGFYYEDFRKGWQDGIRMSKENNMYRQQYCGCIFSEEERYLSRASK